MLYEISKREFDQIDTAPSPQNDTNSLRVFKKYNVNEQKFFDIAELNSRYFLMTEKLPVLKAMLPLKKEILYVAARALEPDYVNVIATYPEPRVIQSTAPRLNLLRDSDIRSIQVQAQKDIEALELVTTSLEN